jgi:hypothetical protein
MDGCIRKAVEWCEDLPSYVTTHVQKMELTETIGVTLDLHFRLLNDGSFKTHVFIWRGYGAMGKRGRWGFTIK